MRTCIVTLQSTSAYSQGKHIAEVRRKKEDFKEFQKRTWRQRLWANTEGNVIIPPLSFKNCLAEAAKYLNIKIPGKGQQNYTKKIEAGVMVMDPLVLDIKADQVEGEWLFVPSDGKRGGGKCVDKCFPKIASWSGQVTFYILDEIITEEIFREILMAAGGFVGIGRWRPANNGLYGRFKPINFEWQEEEVPAAA